jgi:hypothetical protein
MRVAAVLVLQLAEHILLAKQRVQVVREAVVQEELEWNQEIRELPVLVVEEEVTDILLVVVIINMQVLEVLVS